MSKKKGSLPLVDLEKASKHAQKLFTKEKALELLDKKEVVKTGKKCHCGGNIVELKSWRHRSFWHSGMNVDPLKPIPCFSPLHCENCGIQYFKLPKAGH